MNALIRSAVAAVLLAVPVAVETLVRSDTMAWWGHVVFAVTQLVGWALLLSLCGLLTARLGGSRWGSRLVRAGCVLQIVFAAGYGVTTVLLGEPYEGTFVAFLLAFLALTVGGLIWGIRILRTRDAAPAGMGLVAVAVLGFLALAVGADPFHDIFLLSSYAAWVAVGRGTEHAVRRERLLVSGGWR